MVVQPLQLKESMIKPPQINASFSMHAIEELIASYQAEIYHIGSQNILMAEIFKD